MNDKKNVPDLKELLLSKEEFERISSEFNNKALIFFKKNRNKIFTLKGSPEILGLSTTFGPYMGKNRALYISKNSEKIELKNIDIQKFFLSLEKKVIEKIGNNVFWRSNLIVDQNNQDEVKEIEFIPIAFKGKFLLNILKKGGVKIPDTFGLIHASVIEIGKIFHEIISTEGYQSTYPKYLENFENITQESFDKEIKNADFYVDLQFTEKMFFTSKEIELMEQLSESSLEYRIGLELVKEAIPFVIQYEIKDDFPKQQSKNTMAKPEFIILDFFNPIAIYCDSYKFHQRQKDQILKDRRIDRRLQRIGFKVLRFSEEEILNNIQGCVEEIKAQFLGTDHALSSKEVICNRIEKINFDHISDWEKEFVVSLKTRLIRGDIISLKDEKILQQIETKLRKNI